MFTDYYAEPVDINASAALLPLSGAAALICFKRSGLNSSLVVGIDLYAIAKLGYGFYRWVALSNVGNRGSCVAPLRIDSVAVGLQKTLSLNSPEKAH